MATTIRLAWKKAGDYDSGWTYLDDEPEVVVQVENLDAGSDTVYIRGTIDPEAPGVNLATITGTGSIRIPAYPYMGVSFSSGSNRISVWLRGMPASGAVSDPTVSVEDVEGLEDELTAIGTALAGKSDTGHQHSGADITSGTIASAYLPATVAYLTAAPSFRPSASQNLALVARSNLNSQGVVFEVQDINGTAQFQVYSTGGTVYANNYSGSGGVATYRTNNDLAAIFYSGGRIGWTGGGLGSTADSGLGREAAGVVRVIDGNGNNIRDLYLRSLFAQEQASDPSAPSSGRVVIYADASGNLKYRLSNGTIKTITAT